MLTIIEEPRRHRIALHHLGFRPFFLLAGLFAVAAVAVWLWVLGYQGDLPQREILGSSHWHAHEMLFGYTFAVIAGFLLTAERNWTGIQTLHGIPLLLLALLWTAARVMPFIPYDHAIALMAVLDLTFDLLLCIALLHPIARVRQWKHLAIWSKVCLLAIANLLFYLDVLGYLDGGRRLGLYTALYIIVSLIMLLARRVIPFFIEKGVGYSVTLRNRRWLDLGSLLLMLVFIVFELFVVVPAIAAASAAALTVVHAWRLQGWYTHGIWKKPLLWVLYLGYAWLIAGFLLKTLSYSSLHPRLDLDPMLAVHAFAYGGIGMITLGMMTRVSLGHTGRNVFRPPRLLAVLFALLLTGSIVRVLFPLPAPTGYMTWIVISQWLWIAAFAGFVLLYAPMLIQGRIDGKYG